MPKSAAIPDKSLFKVRVPIQVRFRDTDAMGHINNAVYLSYLELARVRYFAAVADFKDHRDISFILARVEIDYRSPALLTDDLAVYIRTQSLGGAKFISEYLVLEEKTQRVVVTAETVQVCYDYERSAVTRLSPDLRAKIEALEGRKF